jgi:hypothetical protein
MKTIILPTQARDKHSENSKESGVFSQGCPTSPTPTSEYDGTSVRLLRCFPIQDRRRSFPIENERS